LNAAVCSTRPYYSILNLNYGPEMKTTVELCSQKSYPEELRLVKYSPQSSS
jgi:hypothetical protein